jgi:uncharacterized protein (DUF608 family)
MERLITGVDVEGVAFDPVFRVQDVPGTPAGFRWVYLGPIETSRSYRQITITAPRGLNGLDRLVTLQVMQRLSSGEIERRIAHERSGAEPVSGVPLGGVGAGKLEFCRDGIFRNITINGNIDTPIWRSEDTFFAVRAESNGRASGRIIASEPLHGLSPMQRLDYDGCYPLATLHATDDDFPLSVEVRAAASIIPRNIKDSALPLALFTVRITADSGHAANATLAICTENFLGCGGSLAPSLTERHVFDEGYYECWEERAGNHESAWEQPGAAGICFEGGNKEEIRSNGQYILATDSPVSSRLTGWRCAQDDGVWRQFINAGVLPGSLGGASSGEQTAGAVAVQVDLQPGESREIRFVFAWYVPHFWQAPGPDYGHYYTRDFSSAAEVAQYGLQHFHRLVAGASEVPALLADSTLPAWLARTLANDAYTFSTVTWFTKDGRFAVNEGPTHMFGCMGTLDQKLYGSHYYSLFYPELDRTELLGFARTAGPRGGMQHDLGYGHLEQQGKETGWPDLTSSITILSLKHYQLTGDQTYIDEVYPTLIRGLFDYQLGMDTDGDGIANISGVGNTFDAERFEGTSSYIATVWLAALKALEDLAERRGDDATAIRCREIFSKARDNAIKQLWNGCYFANYYDSTTGIASPNCHFSQVAGEFFARLCNLGPLYGDHYVRKALLNMLRLNYHQDLVFPTNEATPEGNMPVRTMWGWLPHARVYLAGTPILFGMAEQGLNVLERLDRVPGELNNENRWDSRLFYEPDTGREHWGRFYMTAPATWYAYQALVGYFWDQPKGILGLMPHLPKNLLPFGGPIFLPGFWAWLEVDDGHQQMRLHILKRFEHNLQVNTLRVPAYPGTPLVEADGAAIALQHQTCDPDREGETYACALDLETVDELHITWR